MYDRVREAKMVIQHGFSSHRLVAYMHFVIRFSCWPIDLHLSPLCPVRVARVCRRPSSIKHLHPILSWASSSLSEQDWRSVLIVSFHLCFGHPRFLLPSTRISLTLLMSSSLSLRHTCPNHSSLLLLIKSVILMTLASLMLTFVLCSSRLVPRQYHSILISQTLLAHRWL